ncbi:MAG: carboxypeptidase regulatory-like domain-containing protein, partial [Caldilineaceae bacterium]|nr:carboxypeptidase regulatory-like domain-containing protein [Caldilineaceae bacterium]
MELHEYPRPANDTGIGVHWSTGYATAIGMRQIREFWIPEMKALGVKWVKIYNHDGALDFAEYLLAEGFMPIVRIYRPTPNPSRLDVKDVVQIDAFLRVGVRYFEYNSEPDRDAEWKGGRMPANGINLVVENTIANLEVILERGGMPAVPAVSNGSRWDLVGKIVAFGRKDLFAGPVWQAVHNYSRNRPLDYPYDIGNQEGAAYTYRFYQTLNEEAWQENAWRGRALEEINRLRHDRSNPGATIMDDAACWLAYEYFDALNQKHLGHSIPILSTECGYLVGEDIDPRYPATTPDLHMAQTLEAARVMMGTSQRFAPAPDYYFCSAFWLLANAQLGSTSSWWETHAWYSDQWPDGTLPVVLALKAEPKIARHWHGTVAEDLVTLHGTVAHAGEYRTVLLHKGDVEVARTILDSHSRYRFAELAPGAYTIQLPGTRFEQPVQLSAGQQELVVDFDLTAARAPVSKSRVEGSVRGGAGAMLVLVRSDDGEEWVTMAKDDGSFRFIDLSAGAYSLRVDPQGSRIEQLTLDGMNQHTVELAVAGWGYTIRDVAPDLQKEAKLNAVYVVVEGHRGLPVRVHAGEWSSEPVYTGTAPEAGEYGCELTGLEAAHYIVTVDGVPDFVGRYTQLEARVEVDKKATPLLEFVYTEMMTSRPLASSRIDGRVIGGPSLAVDGPSAIGRPVVTSMTAILMDSMGRRSEVPVAADGSFVFSNLSAGLYTVALFGHEDVTTVTDLALDGNNVATVELRLPVQQAEPAEVRGAQVVAHSIIHGIAPNAAGKLARLVDMVGNEFQQYVDADQRFHFAELPAGTYSLSVESGYTQSKLVVDGFNGLEVHFAELIPSWEAEVSNAGSMPGYSLVRVEVE